MFKNHVNIGDFVYEAEVVKSGFFLFLNLSLISGCPSICSTMQHLSVVVRRSVVVSSRANPVSAHHSPLLPSNEGSGLPGKAELFQRTAVPLTSVWLLNWKIQSYKRLLPLQLQPCNRVSADREPADCLL